MKDERGITMVELLAVLVLMSIVMTAIWTVFSIGSAHSALETNKTKLQQEANIVTSRLRNEHRQNDSYFLRFDSGSGNLEIKTDLAGDFTPVTSGGFEYSGQIDGVDFTSLDPAKVYNSEIAHTDVVLKVSKLGGDPSVEVSTKLTRILSD